MKSKRPAQPVLVMAVAASLLSACGSAPTQVDSSNAQAADGSSVNAYCVDENNQVVDEDLCDNDGDRSSGGGGGGYFIWMGPGLFSRGDRVVVRDSNTGGVGGTRIDAKDSSAREQAGLPKQGRIGAGSKVGGLGSGNSAKGSGSAHGGGS